VSHNHKVVIKHHYKFNANNMHVLHIIKTSEIVPVYLTWTDNLLYLS